MTRSVFNHRRGFTTKLDPLTWTQQGGTWGINSNAAYCSTSGSLAAGSGPIATVDIQQADCQVQVAYGGTLKAAGIVFRFSDLNNYWFWESALPAGTGKLWKLHGGTFTTVATAGGAITTGHSVIAVCNGTSIKIYQDTTTTALVSVTDSFNQSATIVGMFTDANDTTVRLDNFKAYTVGGDPLCSDSFNRTNSTTNLGATDGN